MHNIIINNRNNYWCNYYKNVIKYTRVAHWRLYYNTTDD